MQDERAKKLLEEGYAELYADPIYASAQTTYRKLKLRHAARELAARGELSLSAAAKALRGVSARVIEEGESHLVVLLGAGLRGMNPAVVELRREGGLWRLDAWAKEGLIPQRTAQKALGICAAALNNEGTNEGNNHAR